MKIKVGVSNHHIHLSEETYQILFKDEKMTIRNNLNQPNQFASNQTVTLKTLKNEIKNVRVLGPNRDYTQVEISKTDAYKLGLNPPIRESGNLQGASLITIISSKATITLEAAIIANRHIHINQEIREQKGLVGIEKVKVQIKGEKGGILENVYLKDSKDAYFELHLDTDDANAFLLKNNDEVDILLNDK